MNPPSLFQDQGLLVVDVTQGIAPVLIVEAARRGANVLFSARPDCEADAQRVVEKARAAGLGDRVHFSLTSLSTEEQVEALLDVASERLETLNAVIHNLESRAVFDPRPLVEISLVEWNSVLSSELRVPFMLARRAVEEYLFARVNGRIVYVAYSASDEATTPASYATAQSGLHALIRCITKEFGRREVACNAVVAHRDYTPANPTELIETILFLASPESAFVNGEFLEVG